MKNVWVLTEEMPKGGVIKAILEKVSADQGIKIEFQKLRIIPILKEGRFSFVYKAEGVVSKDFENVFIKIASGNSSFVDFLIFLQKEEPDQNSKPLYAIEETKTDDSESRNTGVYQRCSKFVYVEFYFPGIKKIMLYNLQIPQKKKPTETNIFGTRMLRTIGVEILGKTYDENVMRPFSSLEEFIQVKSSMRMPPAGNVPIQIKNNKDSVSISGRLYKAGGIGHDPNIGALTIIALCVRKWEKDKPIVITHHGLKQEHLGKNNKFIQIAKRLNVTLEGLRLPDVSDNDSYWHYENSQEKMATIFLNVILLSYTNAKVIYANHGGSERGYFIPKATGPVAIEKYQEGKREVYKAGDKTAIIYLPDVIVFDPKLNQIINVEGKRFATRKNGIAELANFSYIEDKIIKPSYSPDSIVRTVSVFGGNETSIPEKEIGFMLNSNGEIILGKEAPSIFKEAVDSLLLSQTEVAPVLTSTQNV